MLLLKIALRRTLKAPVFALTAVLMLALGVAMSTLAFTTTNGVLLRPLPFHDPEQLVRVETASPKEISPMVAPGNAMDVRDELHDVGEFGLFMPQHQNVSEPGQPAHRERGMAVSANVLSLLGIQPALGRGFLPGEDEPNQAPVVLLTDRFWRERFGADPTVLGRVLRIETTNRTVVGVLPPSFDDVLLWSPCAYVTLMTVWPNWRAERGGRWMCALGRLHPGVSRGLADVRIEALALRVAHDHPTEMGADLLRLEPLGVSYVSPQIRMVYWLVVGLALFVLVIACANLGAVQLARALARQGELAVRAALGATRLDLIAALAGESVLIALVGTVLGLLLTHWTAALFSQWVVGVALPMDARVYAFGALAGVIATLCFGLLPAWFITGTLARPLKESARGSTGSPSQHRLKHGLIVAQLGLALVLVSTAASLVLGVRAFSHRDRGWRPAGLVAGALQIPWDRVTKEQQDPRMAQVLATKLGNIPGVERVAFGSDVLIYGDTNPTPVFIEGEAPVPPGREPIANIASVNAAFFSTLGVSLREGRLFADEWRRTDPPVALVSVTTARRLWPNGTALGKRIRIGQEAAWHEVIGVVSDATFSLGYDTPATTLQVYRPTQEAIHNWYSFELRSRQPAPALEKSIRAAIVDFDPDIMVVEVSDLTAVLEKAESVGPLNPMVTTFAAAGFVIAMVGLYGVMSQLVVQRRREIGVRMALGADAAHVVRLMLTRGARMLAIGGTIGIAGAYVVGQLFHHAFPELPLFGLVGNFLVALALVTAGLGACYLPSAQAARVNPIEALRAE